MVLSHPQLPVRTALWVPSVSDMAGVARHVLDVLGAGIPGWRVVVLCGPGPLADACRAAGAAVIVDPFGPGHGLKQSIESLRNAIGHLRPDVVHTHLAYADIVAALVIGKRGPKVVTTEHGIAADDSVYHGSAWRSRTMAAVHHQRFRRVDALIAVSNATLKAVEEKWRPGANVLTQVIPNGIDRLPASSERSPGLHVASLSRLAPEKGLADLIDAFAQLHSNHPGARLTVAGVGPLADDLADQVHTAGLEDVVTFPGYMNANELLESADVIAQLSVWENCSYTLLDAVRAGLGVAATGVGGNPEVLPSRCLVSRGDTIGTAKTLAIQGMNLNERPELPALWPTVPEMTAAIASVYDKVLT